MLPKLLAAVLLAAVAAPALLLAACFEDGEPSEPGVTAVTATPGGSPTPETNSPEDAIREYRPGKLQIEYVGDCEAAQLPGDEGKLCTSFRGDRGSMKAYMAGPTFSEFSAWIFVEEKAGRWKVVRVFPIKPQAADVPGIPWPLTVGAEVVVTSTGQCLNVREGPGLDMAAIDCLQDGTTIKLGEGPENMDDFEWWRIEGRDGWVASDWLRYPDALE